ncbi:MAG TPA: hypothetical protein VGN64_07190 [Dyadobacter sp.]|jgi:hypothetical protein|nr:hypothetical protein [Dyadobacter sp.]
MKIWIVVLLVLSLLSCKKTEPDLEARVRGLANEIVRTTEQKSCATSEKDCRIKSVGCGSAFVYNVSQLDTIKLMAQFSELERLVAQLPPKQYDCDIITPDSTFIYECKCVAGSKKR